MSFSRRWTVDSRARWREVLRVLRDWGPDCNARPLEIVVRAPHVEKTGEQRRLWHALIGELAPHLGLTPAEAKLLIKRLHFGVALKTVQIAGREVALEIVPSSEDLGREQYSELIDYTLRLAAEQGVVIPDRRPQ